MGVTVYKVLCSFLKQHYAHLSLQLFLIVFNCSVALMKSSWRITSAHFMSDVSGSHCKMVSESPGQFNIFTLHVTANVSVAPFVSTTVDDPYPNDFTYMLRTFSPSDAAVSFNTRLSH